uniref:S24 family peptidase n=1 Tax=Roseburia sp. TaxID=2049040 RepID=UPI003FEF160F
MLSPFSKETAISNKIGQKVGVTGSAITNYEKETSHPKEQIIYKLMETLGVNANYLFQDCIHIPPKGNDINLSEYEHIKKYRGLDKHGKEMVDFTLEKEYERIKKYGKLSDEPNKISQFPKRLISYYFKNASAGTGQLIIDNLPDTGIEIPDKPEYRNVSYAISVNGSSMEPAFHDGDILLVEATREIEVGDIGIFQIDNECFVKKLGEAALISLNKDYKDIPLNETAITLGKVIDKLNS